jgi:hypothetical protein
VFEGFQRRFPHCQQQATGNVDHRSLSSHSTVIKPRTKRERPMLDTMRTVRDRFFFCVQKFFIYAGTIIGTIALFVIFNQLCLAVTKKVRTFNVRKVLLVRVPACFLSGPFPPTGRFFSDVSGGQQFHTYAFHQPIGPILRRDFFHVATQPFSVLFHVRCVLRAAME